MAFHLKLDVNKSILSVENSTAANHVTSIFRVSKMLRDCKNNKDKKKKEEKRKNKREREKKEKRKKRPMIFHVL